MTAIEKFYVGLDVSSKKTAVCIVDIEGSIIHESMIDTSPRSLDAHLKSTGLTVSKIGIESTNLAIWLCRELGDLGYPIICVESHHASAFMSAQKIKTDRNDARGLAQLMRCNLYREVHIKSDENQRLKLLLNNRRFLVEQRVNTENQIRGSLKTFGLMIGAVTKTHYSRRVRELIEGDGELEVAILPLLDQRDSCFDHIKSLDQLLVGAAKTDPVSRLLMTAPGVGPLTAILYKAVVDDPTRFKRSRDIPPHLGLAPQKYASGEVDYNGSITRAGDSMLRYHLYKAAESATRQSARPSSLKKWARTLEKRSSYKVSRVAVARKLSIILHRMWMDGMEYDWSRLDEEKTKLVSMAA